MSEDDWRQHVIRHSQGDDGKRDAFDRYVKAGHPLERAAGMALDLPTRNLYDASAPPWSDR